MKYLGPKFSVSMPGGKVKWPFAPAPGDKQGMWICTKCLKWGDEATLNRPHVHAADVNRPRKRICFGR